MKIIDLLNKIANGEEVPKHIHIRDVDSYTWKEDVKAYWSDIDENNLLSDLDLSITDLKEDVEILEENKIPEKLNEFIHVDSLDYRTCNRMFETLTNKYNEIIDYLKSKGE